MSACPTARLTRWRQFMLKSEIKKVLPKRRPGTHKGDYGRVLVVAGSKGMLGAGALVTRAALRVGAGLVYWAVPDELVNFANLFTPDVMVIPHNKISGQKADIIAIGPGCGINNNTRNILRSLLASKKPLVIDADALTLLAQDKRLAAALHAKVILTPHPGEMARLTAKSVAEVQKDRLGIAKKRAAELGTIVILKGEKTVVADQHGKIYLNDTGNPGMGTAGSGDVLTGMLAGLAGQGHDLWSAAKVGVYLHGLAGDLAAKDKGEPGLIASDIIERIPDAIQKSY